jgi:hypothetical protein
MSFVYISDLLKSLNLLTILFGSWVSSVSINYVQASRSAKVNGVDAGRFPIKNLPLYVFAHVLYNCSLSVHCCRLLCLGLGPQFIEGALPVYDIVNCRVFGRLLLHLVHLNT